MLRCLNNLCSSEYDEDLVQGATTYLNRPDLNPQLITPLISSLLAVKYAGVKVAKGVEALPPDLEINESQVPVQQIASDEFLINALNKINLAVPAMVPVICDLRRHLTSMILETSRIPEGYIALVCAIAHQSFHSGYLNFIEADERETLSSLAALLEKEIHEGRGDLTVLTPLILLYAMFLPLQNLGCFFELGERPLDHWPPCVRPLIRHIILDPIEERALARDIPRFAPIEDDISRKVQEQYEEHPYPRWTRIQAQPQPLSYQQRISARLFRGSRVTVLGPDAFSRTENFEVLVAGCGTGKHPAQVAKWCSNVSVVAVDLSRTSLGYAKRKTQCQEIRNIQFFHGDILNIHALGKTFPAIESIGVLHHMADPNEGLAALRNILAPRGILYLGLYSKRARQGVVAARKHIEALGLDPSNNNIRLLRHQILTGEKFAEYPELKSWLDLFYMSGVRDLLFHAQEHQFTPLQIKDLCETHNLKFLGFASLERKTVVAYRELFPEDTEMTSLANWDRFEQVHPQTFACMLNFICQAI